MARESWQALRRRAHRRADPARKRRHHPLVASLPLRWRFYRSGLYISPLAPLLLGMFTGVLTMLMGIGGGFVLVPAMLYILGMSANVVVGTSLFQILFVTMATTMMHALTTKAVDIVLAVLLLIGSVTGAQIGAQLAQKLQPGTAAVRAGGDRAAGCPAHGAGARLPPGRDLHGDRRCEALLALDRAFMLHRCARSDPGAGNLAARDPGCGRASRAQDLLLFGAILNPRGHPRRARL
jgi:hypothetical protein